MRQKMYANKDCYHVFFDLIIDRGIKFNSIFPALDHSLCARYGISFAKIFDLNLYEFLSLLQPVCKAQETFVKCFESLFGDAL